MPYFHHILLVHNLLKLNINGIIIILIPYILIYSIFEFLTKKSIVLIMVIFHITFIILRLLIEQEEPRVNLSHILIYNSITSIIQPEKTFFAQVSFRSRR